MSANWKSLAGTLILGMLAAFAYGGFCIYTGVQDAALAQSENSISARVSMHTQTSKSRNYGFYSCDYSFEVNGVLYSGHERCSLPSSAPTAKDYIQTLAGVPQITTATVYYDPADPATNSLTEFGLSSASAYLRARLSFGFGALFIILLVLGAAVASNAGKGGGGIVVDDQGTVIYPDKLDSVRQEIEDNSKPSGSEKEQSDHSANF